MWPQDHLPTGVTLSVTLFIILITLIRLALTLHTSIFGRLINTLLGFDAAAAFLREPIFAEHVARVIPGGLPTVFDTWHWLTVTAWAFGLGMALLHENGPVRYRIQFRIVLGLSAGIGLAFLVLSGPARAQGMSSVAEYGGWRYGVYIALYSALPVLVSCYYYVLKIRGTVWRTTTLWERISVATLVLFGIASSLPVCLMAIAAILDAAGAGNAFTQGIYDSVSKGFVSGEPGLFIFAALTLVFIPSSAQAIVQLLRMDAESRAARRMYPVWRDLTAAAPQVVFQLKRADSWNVSPQERLHRRRMEIHDAAEIVARYVAPLPVAVDELVESTVEEDDQEHMRMVAELALACHRLTEGGKDPTGEPTARGAEVPDEQTLLRLWQPAKSLLHEATGLPVERRTALGTPVVQAKPCPAGATPCGPA
ncbi:hypothetical protein DFR70_101692 [Nocardia tenerifensis]|uniref:DUF6545 domain-containing protein n=1 Tax=Nocardia tenerifensis TaxID=228006 RepID=A0A318KNK7_9NOCA|nr:DUF6545 domain-containing protein [Nocardia tenerifensis]PXX71270.1 hypothetical protein DFR70_101692 [Nocardia tenerifensis]